MINGHLINHYYIIELFNDLMGKNRFPQSGGKLDSLPLIAPRQGRTHKSKRFLLKASGLKEGGI